MRSEIVGIADCLVTADPDVTLVTYALGSCIGLGIYDPVSKVGGLLHFMLPDSSIDPRRAVERPFMFADTAIPRLFHAAYDQGAEKRRMIVRAAGGAQVMDERGVFDIGKRNYLALRKILWKAGVLIHAEDIGGTQSRTVRLEVTSGAMWLHGASGERELVPAGAKGAFDGIPRTHRR